MEFIDIRGASGSIYRFRRWPASGVHPPIAGNYALISAGTRALATVGVLEDLSRLPTALSEIRKSAQLFTRLNISRSRREAEHADIALAHPALVPAAGEVGREVA
jgi:hypothetical protein